MSEDGVIAIATIPLARSRRRMLLAPGLLLLTAAVAIGGGLVVGGWEGIGMAVAGVVLVLVAFYLVLIVSTVRLDVEVSTLRLRWLGVDRRYGLARGAVTRVPLVGEQRARLRPRFGAFGWGLGPARLRGKERITLVRLARTNALILVPTDGGRVAIAPRSEEQLLEALTAAARVQQRLDQVTAHVRSLSPEQVVEEAPAVEPIPEVVPAEGPSTRVLTGIERTLIEERLAAERARALAAAEAEQQAADEAARLAADEAARLAADEAARLAAEAAAQAEVARAPAAPAAESRAPRATMGRPRIPLSSPPRERLTSLAVAMVPLLVAVAAWGAAGLTGRLDLADNAVRDASIALTLVGPVAALGALVARAWFPRLTGLVTVTALCGMVLVGRALIG